MTNRVLWLLSYLGLSLALSLGNRQTGGEPAGGPSLLSAEQQQQRTALAYEPTRHAARSNAALHDWLVYDKRPADSAMLSADRLVLLDDVLSAVLGNFYRQQQQQQRHQRQEPAQRPSLGFLDDEEEDEEEQQQQQQQHRLLDEEDLPRRMMLRSSSSRPLDSPSLYVEQLKPRTPPARRSSSSSSSSSSGSSLGYLEPAKSPAGPSKRNNQPVGAKEAQPQQQQQQRPGQLAPAQAIAAAGASMASQFMLRSARGNRQYDVPQIECPLSDDGMERFACPTADRMGRYRCIDDHVLCDGFIDCPTGEDEDRQACMFYKTTKAHLDVLADALLRWARGR